MSSQPRPYQIIGQAHINHWDDELKTTVPGWEVTARWLSPRAIIPVFVPDTADLVAGADILIRAKGEELAQLHGLTG